jgi:hypothetical protein
MNIKHFAELENMIVCPEAEFLDSRTSTVGTSIMTHTRIMACGTSGDDLMHLKTSHIKSRVIL